MKVEIITLHNVKELWFSVANICNTTSFKRIRI